MSKDQDKDKRLIDLIKLKQIPEKIDRSELTSEAMKALMDSNDPDFVKTILSDRLKMTGKEMAEYRIDDPSCPIPGGYSPLEYAMSREESLGGYEPKLGSAEALVGIDKDASIIRKDANINLDQIIQSTNADLDGFTPLTYFVSKSNLKVTASMLDNGADPNFQGRNGLPLHIAFYNIDAERPKNTTREEVEKTDAAKMTNLLMERGADPDKESVVFVKASNTAAQDLQAKIDELAKPFAKQRSEVEKARAELVRVEKLAKLVGPEAGVQDPETLKKLQSEIGVLKSELEVQRKSLKELEGPLQEKRKELTALKKTVREIVYTVDPNQKGASLQDSVVKKQMLQNQDVRQGNPIPTLYDMVLDKQKKVTPQKDSVASVNKIHNQIEKVDSVKQNIGKVKEKLKEAEDLKSMLPEKPSYKQLKSHRHAIKAIEKEVKKELSTAKQVIKTTNEALSKAVQESLDAQVELSGVLKEQQLAKSNLKTLQEKAQEAEKTGNQAQQTAAKEEVAKAEQQVKGIQVKVSEAEKVASTKSKDSAIAQMSVKTVQKLYGKDEMSKLREQVTKLKVEAEQAKIDRNRASTISRIKRRFSNSSKNREDRSATTGDIPNQSKPQLQKTSSTAAPSKDQVNAKVEDMMGFVNGQLATSAKKNLASKVMEGIGKEMAKEQVKASNLSSQEPQPVKTPAPTPSASASITEKPKDSVLVSNNKIDPSIKAKAQAIGEMLKSNNRINASNALSSNVNSKKNEQVQGRG